MSGSYVLDMHTTMHRRTFGDLRMDGMWCALRTRAGTARPLLSTLTINCCNCSTRSLCTPLQRMPPLLLAPPPQSLPLPALLPSSLLTPSLLLHNIPTQPNRCLSIPPARRRTKRKLRLYHKHRSILLNRLHDL